MFLYCVPFLIISFISAATIPSPGCPPGWIALADSFTCYFVSNQTVDWQTAKSTCSSLLPNTALVIIDNAPEAALLVQITGNNDIWVGDEVASNGPVRLCVKGANGGQRLVVIPCTSLQLFVCEFDISPNPCKPLPPTAPVSALYFPHVALPYKFIQCTLSGQYFVNLCAKGTLWSQSMTTCVLPSQRRRRNQDYYIVDENENNNEYDNDGPYVEIAPRQRAFNRNNYYYKTFDDDNFDAAGDQKPQRPIDNIVEYGGYPLAPRGNKNGGGHGRVKEDEDDGVDDDSIFNDEQPQQQQPYVDYQ